LDICLVGPLLGMSWRGADVRRELGQEEAESLLEGQPKAMPSTLLH
jgi:hypothetical protein